MSRTGWLFLSEKQGTDLFEVVLRLLRVKPLFLTLTLTLTSLPPIVTSLPPPLFHAPRQCARSPPAACQGRLYGCEERILHAEMEAFGAIHGVDLAFGTACWQAGPAGLACKCVNFFVSRRPRNNRILKETGKYSITPKRPNSSPGERWANLKKRIRLCCSAHTYLAIA